MITIRSTEESTKETGWQWNTQASINAIQHAIQRRGHKADEVNDVLLKVLQCLLLNLEKFIKDRRERVVGCLNVGFHQDSKFSWRTKRIHGGNT